MSAELIQYFAEYTNRHTGRVHSTFCLGENFAEAEKAWEIRYGDHSTLDSLTEMGIWNSHRANCNAIRTLREFDARNPH